MVSLGSVPDGGDFDATGVNTDGTVIVGWFHIRGDSHAFLWNAESGIVDLNTSLPALGIDLNGWTLLSANAVSADGRTLTGTGTFKGKEQAWIATLGASVPAELRVTGPEVARVHATGFQVYTWDATTGWKFKCPDATFEGSHGMTGKHYAGPTWECTNDGSKVSAKPIAEHPGDGDAVKWLLLKADSTEGHGVLSSVTYIQRLNTTGGTKPSSVNAKEGDEARVPYTADYVFLGPGARSTTPAR